MTSTSLTFSLCRRAFCPPSGGSSASSSSSPTSSASSNSSSGQIPERCPEIPRSPHQSPLWKISSKMTTFNLALSPEWRPGKCWRYEYCHVFFQFRLGRNVWLGKAANGQCFMTLVLIYCSDFVSYNQRMVACVFTRYSLLWLRIFCVSANLLPKFRPKQSSGQIGPI